jgi:hypothetical protein
MHTEFYWNFLASGHMVGQGDDIRIENGRVKELA